ncbi:MAG: AMP-binding protein [Clostridiales bacterium]|nr:AMP-binding protein [Clostridiales bacterium]MDD7310255.1 AMP-binding protein [Eubacteriales bacterium]MDY5346926.1 AMP-binding protein [Eubacteriales bacterium]
MKNDMYAIMKNGFLDITIGSWLHRVSEFYPDQDALVNVDRGVRLSWKQLDRRAVEVAKGLHAMGIRRGDKVAIWATNYPEWLYLLFGCSKIGAILVTVNTNYKIFELEYLLRQSDTKALFYIHGVKGSDYTPIVKPLLPEIDAAGTSVGLHSDKLPFLEDVVYIPYDANDPAPEHLFTWQNMIDGGAAIEDSVIEAISAQLSPHDVINMQYTSGTTGFPKGVMLTHYNILNNGYYIGENMRFSPKDRLCITVPLFHCFGLVLATMASLTHATTMVLVDYFSPTKVLTSIEKEHCTAVHGVPTMYIFMLDHPDFDKFNLSSLRTGIMAGSPCPINVMRQVVDRMGMKEITITYGQTEASPATTMTNTDDPLELRVSTVGRSMPFVETKIVDPETGETLPDGQTGEFCSRGYNTMRGYYKMEEATKAAIDADGWLHSGDLAVRDPNGYYRITGRIKDMIIRGGENIYPREIEELIYTHPAVQDVQVVGVPSKKFGEEVMAFVILKQDQTATEDEIKEFVRQNMSRHKIPSYIRFIDAFPMNAAGKILKYKLRSMADEMVNGAEKPNT